MPKEPTNLKRFKASLQGVREFALLLEQSDAHSHDIILAAAQKEDPVFTEEALRKVVYFEELIYLEEAILAEILAKVSPKVLAFALHGMEAAFCQKVLGQLGYREKKQLQEEQENQRHAPSQNFILGAQRQVLKHARSLESQGKFTFELADCPRFHKKRKTG